MVWYGIVKDTERKKYINNNLKTTNGNIRKLASHLFEEFIKIGCSKDSPHP